MPPPPRPPSGRPGAPGAGGNAGRPAAPRPASGGMARPPAAKPAAPGRQPTPAQAARVAEADLEARFDKLDRRIQQLKVEYNRFFAGDLKQPPMALREEIDAEMKRLRSLNLRRSVDGFRLGALEAQLNSYREMYDRRQRDIEEGRSAPRHAARTTAATPRHDVDAGVVLSPRLEGDAVEALFKGLVERNPRGAMDLDTFRNYLQRQMAQIRDKTGCEAVQFRVVAEDGKVKLKAKPVGAAGGGP